MRPRGPNEKMKEMEVVNGGEISGSRVAASIRWVQAEVNRARETHQQAQQETVEEGAAMARLGENGEEGRNCQATVFEKGGRKHHEQWVDDE